MKKLFLLVGAALALVLPAGATWSIVVVNRRTGEVAVAGATCIQQLNLLQAIPVALVGKGGGVIQASGDPAGLLIIHAGLLAAEDPAVILQEVLDAAQAPGQHQIGIVSFDGAPVTFTGRNAQAAKGGVVGEVGDLSYAIQGNVLTSSQVWLSAEQALLSTPGDLGQKVLAAMEAARSFGGDGRCSCSITSATSCGAPPPGFTKSAHCGFVVVLRIGDVDSPCTQPQSCATGSYYMKLNVAGANAQQRDDDPVIQLQAKYDTWRANRLGRPDGILSTVDAVQSMPADGATKRTVTVRLVDIDGVPLASGGASVAVATVDGLPSLASVGPVVDHGDGSYSFELAAGTRVGLDRFVITADDGIGTATLYPYLDVRLDAPAPLHAGFDTVSASEGATVPFVVNVPTKPKGVYWILGSLSGTTSSLGPGPFSVPLVPDAFLWTTFRFAGTPGMLPGTHGFLDASGRAEGAFVAGPGQLLALAGMRIDWAASVLGKGPPLATNAVGFDVLP
jgi:uncharacterized Ntn-hydrolase superfamily protein